MSPVLRASIFTLVFPGTVLVAIPWGMLAREPRPPVSVALRLLGVPLAAAGAAALLWCIRDFAVTGRGTPAPWDPPEKLVTRGLYRFVRNPMYLALLAVLGGEALFFGSRWIATYAAILWLAFHLRVVLVEEPTLRNLFGSEYERYRATVPRWIPKFA